MNLKPCSSRGSFLAVFLLTVILSACNTDRKGNRAASETVKDINGNTYSTIKIGKQVWMAENLATTAFNDGSPIPEVTDPDQWYQLRTPGFCWYNNDSSTYKKEYGALYNYYAMQSGKLCPEGWRVPSSTDFQALLTHLDRDANLARHESSTIAGGKLKQQGNLAWSDPNTDATNSSGFNALPGGCRSYAGNFSMQGAFGYYGAYDNETSVALRSATGSAFMRDKISGYVGVSVRCIKEN